LHFWRQLSLFPPCLCKNDDAVVPSPVPAAVVSYRRHFAHFPPFFVSQNSQSGACLPAFPPPPTAAIFSIPPTLTKLNANRANSANHELEEFAAQTVGLNPLSYGKSVIH